MSHIVSIIWIIGWILFILLVAAAVLLLLLLFVPIRYRGQLRIEDPEPRDEAAWANLRDHSYGHLHCSWFGPMVRFHVTYPDTPHIDLWIAWKHIEVASHDRKEHEDRQRGNSSRKTAPHGLYDRIKAFYRKADYYYRVLRKEDTAYTIARLRCILVRMLHHILPVRWRMTASVGLGDPAATARILEIQGMLFPLLVDHVLLEPVFMQYQMDVSGSFAGRIRLIHPVAAAVSVATDRRIRQTARRLRNADHNIAAHYSKIDRAMQQSENASLS